MYSVGDFTSEHIFKMFKLLAENQWIHNFQLTKFFVDRVWENLPSEWLNPLLDLSTEELNDLPFTLFKVCWPDSLKHFVTSARQLPLPRLREESAERVDIDPSIKRGMNPKKLHEVSYMASIVNKVCAETGCKTVLDVGSGLGYLGQVLHKEYELRVVGLESNSSRTHGADQRVSQQVRVESAAIETHTFELEDSAECMDRFSRLLKCIQKDDECVKQLADEELRVNQMLSATSSCSSNYEKSQETSDVLSKCKCPSDVLLSNSAIDKQSEGNISYNHVSVMDTEKTPCGSSEIPFLSKDSETVNNTLGKNTNKRETSNVPKHSIKPECAIGRHKQVENLMLATSGVCMVGLHCCGDLTPAMLKYFHSLSELRAIVCVSCCYHSMRPDGQDGFKNFPLSEEVCQVVKGVQKDGSRLKVNVFGLRLAAQETRARWRQQSESDHDYHMKNVAYRGVLEQVITTKYGKLNKLKRKVARKRDFESFATYVDSIFNRTTLDSVDTGTSDDFEVKWGEIKQHLMEAFTANEKCFKFVEIVTALQVLLQPVLESLIIVDRLIYLKEQGMSKVKAVPIFDEVISPRNVAIIAVKNINQDPVCLHNVT